jgi:hypothetical protein
LNHDITVTVVHYVPPKPCPLASWAVDLKRTNQFIVQPFQAILGVKLGYIFNLGGEVTLAIQAATVEVLLIIPPFLLPSRL